MQHIASECHKTRCMAAPSNNTMEMLHSLAARIAISVGRPGSSVLIFVPGMRDIEGIVETIEKMYGKIDGRQVLYIMLVHALPTLLQPETVPGVVYTCIPIHGDIPFEDQMTVSIVCRLSPMSMHGASSAFACTMQ